MRKRAGKPVNEALHLDAVSEDDLFALAGVLVVDSSLGTLAPKAEAGRGEPGREASGDGGQGRP